nr:vegetative cell wall protein gp1-like [Aegilops tauschii subsp. strangulata]
MPRTLPRRWSDIAGTKAWSAANTLDLDAQPHPSASLRPLPASLGRLRAAAPPAPPDSSSLAATSSSHRALRPASCASAALTAVPRPRCLPGAARRVRLAACAGSAPAPSALRATRPPPPPRTRPAAGRPRAPPAGCSLAGSERAGSARFPGPAPGRLPEPDRVRPRAGSSASSPPAAPGPAPPALLHRLRLHCRLRLLPRMLRPANRVRLASAGSGSCTRPRPGLRRVPVGRLTAPARPMAGSRVGLRRSPSGRLPSSRPRPSPPPPHPRAPFRLPMLPPARRSAQAGSRATAPRRLAPPVPRRHLLRWPTPPARRPPNLATPSVAAGGLRSCDVPPHPSPASPARAPLRPAPPASTRPAVSASARDRILHPGWLRPTPRPASGLRPVPTSEPQPRLGAARRPLSTARRSASTSTSTALRIRVPAGRRCWNTTAPRSSTG